MPLWRYILVPFSWLYGLVVGLRDMLYDTGIFSSQSVDIPTICVGNISVGGSGKTPMVECLLRLLRPTYNVAVLSLGYKRHTRGFVLANSKSTVRSIGDEMYQLHSKFPDVPIGVCKDRLLGISKLRHHYPHLDCIVLDDAFQYRPLRCGLNIVLTSYDNLYCDDHLLPFGHLRDFPSQVRRADSIIVTKCPPDLTPIAQRMIANQLHPFPYQQLFFSYIEYTDIPLDGVPLIVTGIARPEPLLHRFPKVGVLTFPDHHYFSESDIRKIVSRSKRYSYVLTTEKDYARLSSTNIVSLLAPKQLFVLPITSAFFGGSDVLQALVYRYLKQSLVR